MMLAILETGRPPGKLADQFGDYPAMFRALLGPGFAYETFNVEAGDLPVTPNEHDAYLITGSPAGVYDHFDWIPRLEDFIRAADRSKMVGICFGHQVMASALGGRVEKSARGWGSGLHRYQITKQEEWMDSPAPIAIPASHQDQVVEHPPGSNVIARSDFTPFAALAWTDRPAVSFQFHPEFSAAFARALIEKRYDVVDNAAEAIASLEGPNDNNRVGSWIRRFLEA